MTEPAPQETRAPRWRAKLLIALVVVVVGAIIARQSLAKDDADAGDGQANQLVAGERAEEKEEPGALEKILPFITEAGSAMLLGYMLALATRSVLKMAIFALVLAFVGLQFLAYKGILTVDLGEFAAWIGDNLFNVSPDADTGKVLEEKVPTAGAGLLGYLLGLKKG
ncbi:MAG: FUN14 domain-containing protein [Planctomycetota bacterium]|jgi:uncharacterized membrane protein (Fun14 family)